MSRRHPAINGLPAFLGLATWEVGIPILLIRLVGWPLPHRRPAWTEIWQRLQTNGVPDAVIPDLLAIIVWVIWAYTTALVLVEVLAELRGLPVAARRRFGPLQPVIGALVATIVLAVTSGPSRSPSRTVAPASALGAALSAFRPAAVSVTDSDRVAAGPPNALPAAPTAADASPYAVKEGDALQHIAAQNATATADTSPYTVQKGDSLWRLAVQRMGSGFRWTTLWLRNRNRPEPGGIRFTDPDLILVGWQLDIPESDGTSLPLSPSEPPLAAASPHRAAVEDPALPAAPPRTVAPSAAPAAPELAPAPDARGAAAGTSSPQEPPAPPPPTSPIASPQAAHSAPGLVSLPTGGSVGAALAAVILGALAVARLHQRRRREPGLPPDGTVDVLARGPVLTALRRAKASAPLDPDEAAAGGVNVEPPPITTSATHAAVAGAAAVDGEQVSLDLVDDLGGVAFTGPGAEGAVRGLIIAAVARTDSVRPELIAVGAAAALVPELTQARSVSTPTPDAATARLEEEILRRSRILVQRQAFTYRALINSDDPVEALVVVVDAREWGGDRAAHLVALSAIAPRLGIGILAVGPLKGFRAVSVAEDGTVDGALGSAARLSHLSAPEAADLLGAVLAGQDIATSTSDGYPIPTRPAVQLAILDQAADDEERRRVELCLFGVPRVLADGQEVKTGLRRSSRALLALLVVRPQGVTMAEGLDILWHEEGAPDAGGGDFHSAVQTARGRLRDVLGREDVPIITYATDRYRLETDTVTADAWRFRRELDRAALAPDATTRRAALERACAEVTGEPLAGMSWGWAEPIREDLRRSAVDALVQLADLREAAGEIDGAIAALQSACYTDPYCEPLARQLMDLQVRHGRGGDAQRTYRVLATRLAELDVEPDDETEALLSGGPSVTAAQRAAIGGRGRLEIVDDETE
ncbi:MAG TPA: BTAD domain-containing putative transcriptional regulator [Candidatus Angelobacter sp.]|jgi:DNA-binding SARP family transcriptional activator/nucleoid-associated protein YgaU|nr:BTAD domain-containing putative transcriptional regulator [Candidatus Angelobacter sp.]